MINYTLKKSILEFSNQYDSDNLEEVEEFIFALENTDDVENAFEIDFITTSASIIILKVLEKRYYTDIAEYIPSINTIRLFFYEKKWKKIIKLVLLEYYTEKEVDKYIDAFFKRLKINEENTKFENNFLFFNPINIFYTSIKMFFCG